MYILLKSNTPFTIYALKLKSWSTAHRYKTWIDSKSTHPSRRGKIFLARARSAIQILSYCQIHHVCLGGLMFHANPLGFTKKKLQRFASQVKVLFWIRDTIGVFPQINPIDPEFCNLELNTALANADPACFHRKRLIG